MDFLLLAKAVCSTQTNFRYFEISASDLRTWKSRAVVNISTNIVMVILEARLNPVITELWDTPRPQQPAGTATLEGQRRPGKELGRQTGRMGPILARPLLALQLTLLDSKFLHPLDEENIPFHNALRTRWGVCVLHLSPFLIYTCVPCASVCVCVCVYLCVHLYKAPMCVCLTYLQPD